MVLGKTKNIGVLDGHQIENIHGQSLELPHIKYVGVNDGKHVRVLNAKFL